MKSNAVKIYESKNKDICITVPHKKVLKAQVKPLVIYRDNEVLTEEIASEIHKIADVPVVVNNTITDVNIKHNFWQYDAENKRHFYEAVEKINPSLVIDIHGSANIGTLFNNARNDGLRFFRDFREKSFVAARPDVDIEWKRKQGYTTATGAVVLTLGQVLSKSGLVVDFEAVYPGGYVIERLSNMKRQCVALEISRNTRDDMSKRQNLINGIATFIKLFRGEEVEEVVDVNMYPDTEKILDKLKEMVGQGERRRTPEAMRYIG